MKEEPKIVRELREEEKLGRLSSKTQIYRDYDIYGRYSANPSASERHQYEEEEIHGRTIQVSLDYERKLLEAEERYEKIFRLSPEAIVLIDRNGIILDINERVYDWLGFRSSEVIGKSILEIPFLNVDEKVKVKKVFLLRMQGKDVLPYELEFLTKNGEKRIGLARGAVLKDEYGNPSQDLVLISDITRQKQSEETLIRTLEHLKELEFIVNRSGAVVFLWRAEEGWPVEFVSENITQFGYTREDFLTDRTAYATMIYGEDLSRVAAEVAKYSQEGVEEFTQEYRVRTKSGEVRWVDDRTWIRRDETGAITHYQGLILDITKRKLAEERVLSERGKLEAATENIGVGIAVISKDYRVVWANHVLKKIFGDVEGKTCYTLYNHQGNACSDCGAKKVLEKGAEKVVHEQIVKDGQGHTSWFEIITTPIRDKNGALEMAMEVVVPITERKRTETLFRTQRDLAIALSDVSTLKAGLSLCLEAALAVSGMSSGGIYLMDRATGALDLVHHKGLSSGFIHSVSHFDADSPNTKLVMKGKPVYSQHQRLEIPRGKQGKQESLYAIAIIPIHHENRIMGCLNVASHTINDVPLFVRDSLEIIASQVGSAIVRLKIQEALSESEEKFKAITAMANDAIVLATADDHVVFWNRAAEKMFGYSSNEVADQKLHDLISPHINLNEKNKKFMALKHTGKSPMLGKTLEFMAKRKDGKMFPIELSISKVTIKNKQHVVEIIRDITKRKNSEKPEQNQEIQTKPRRVTTKARKTKKKLRR